MNYRHAFHAGNFADVMKHVVLVRTLLYLARKDGAFRAIDTHAGIGLYDLSSEEAERTGEWRDGVARLEAPFAPEVEELLSPYRQVLDEVRASHGHAYPGSPFIIRALSRPQDVSVFVELHPADGDVLAARFKGRGVKVLRLDGWTALHALIPSPERRGLVLIDPPYEQPGELKRLAAEMVKAWRKWPTGVFLGWYPIKDPGAVAEAAGILRAAGPAKALRLELMVDAPDDPSRLNGCGLFILNPPFVLKEEAEILLPALAARLARSTYAGFRCEPFGREVAPG